MFTPRISHTARKAKLQMDGKLEIIRTQLNYTGHQAVEIIQHTPLPEGPVPHIVRQWARIPITNNNPHFGDVVKEPSDLLLHGQRQRSEKTLLPIAPRGVAFFRSIAGTHCGTMM